MMGAATEKAVAGEVMVRNEAPSVPHRIARVATAA